MSYDSEVLADSPWVYYSTTEASGTITDDSGNGRDLTTPDGLPTYAQSGPAGASDAMLWPDSSGGTEYYAITSATVGSTLSALSLECWFYLSALPSNPTALVGFNYEYSGANSARPAEVFVDTDGRLGIWWGSSGTSGSVFYSASPVVSTGEWHHVVFALGATSGKARLDKVDVVSGSRSTAIASSAKFLIHGSGNRSGFPVLDNGSEVLVSKPAGYLSTLSDARIDAHFDAMPKVGTLVAESLLGEAAFAGTYIAPISGTIDAIGLLGEASFAGGYDGPILGTFDPEGLLGAADISGTYVGPELFGTLDAVGLLGQTSLDGSYLGVPVEGTFDPLCLLPSAGFEGTYDGPVPTDTSNALNGRSRVGLGMVTVSIPVSAPAVAVTKVDKAVPLPTPDLVNGRPT